MGPRYCLFLLALLISIFQVDSFAQTKCVDLFKADQASVFNEQIIENSKKYGFTDAKKALESFQQVIEKSQAIRDFYSAEKLQELYEQLNNFTEPVYQKMLLDIFSSLNKTGEMNKASLKDKFKEKLTPFFTEEQADARVSSYLNGEASLREALGEMNLEETQKHVYGKDVQNPSPESLIGRFLSEVEESTGVSPQKEWRQFYKGPRGATKGKPKLFVVISDAIYPIFSKYFNNSHFLINTHQANQGTLYMGFNGESFGYAGGNRNGELRTQGYGAVWPMILLSSIEGQRTQLYFNLGQITQSRYGNVGYMSKIPWMITDDKGKPYIEAPGGYSCCTHWIGDMPMGEKLVKQYMFPGAVDSHASSHVGTNGSKEDRAPRVSKIGTHTMYNGSETHPSLQLVWRSQKSPMQLWQVLGLETAQAAAELTNPGYVHYAFISKAEAERVPVVFVFNEENKMPTNTYMRSNISYY